MSARSMSIDCVHIRLSFCMPVFHLCFCFYSHCNQYSKWLCQDVELTIFFDSYSSNLKTNLMSSD
jgi:hypothetical protein